MDKYPPVCPQQASTFSGSSDYRRRIYPSHPWDLTVCPLDPERARQDSVNPNAGLPQLSLIISIQITGTDVTRMDHIMTLILEEGRFLV